jgi:hypothetical protein
VPLVESNYMVEQLTAAAPHPALSHTILPGASERRPRGVYLQGSIVAGTCGSPKRDRSEVIEFSAT